MALLESEVYRIKAELGYNVLTIGALPYVGITSLFDQVIQPYMSAGASTTSSTTVTATSGGSTSPVTLTLASATGFAAGALVVVDVDARQEEATIQSVTGSTITVLLALAHAGVYPVTIEGGESMVRKLLKVLRGIESDIADSFSMVGIKRADEVEFFGGSSANSQYTQMKSAQMRARDELASLLGVANLWRGRSGGNRTVVPC